MGVRGGAAASKLHAHEQEAGNLASPLSPSASEGLADLGTLRGRGSSQVPQGCGPRGEGGVAVVTSASRGLKPDGKGNKKGKPDSMAAPEPLALALEAVLGRLPGLRSPRPAAAPVIAPRHPTR